MKPIGLSIIAAAVLSTAAYAQNTERANPLDANPACMDRNVDSNSAGCLPRDNAARQIIVDPRATTGATSTAPAGASRAAPGLQPAPITPTSGNTPSMNPAPALPTAGNQPLTNPSPTLTSPGSPAPAGAGLSGTAGK